MMMNTILEILFSLTVAGSIVTASIHALRVLSTDHFSAKWRYRLTKMAVALYLLPIAFVIPWLSQFTASSMAADVHSLQPRSAGFVSEPFLPAVTISANAAYVLLGIWAAGGICFAAWQLYVYRRFLKELERTRTIVPENSETAILLKNLKEKLGLKRNVRLAYSPLARSPFLAGLWKPSIYLPIESGAGLDMDMVLHHELIHLKRNDLWTKALTLGVSALHWFNPLAHTVRKEIHIWSELSCDQEVVKEMSHAERKRYGGTLLNVMAGARGLPEQFCASLSGDGKQLKRRLTHMLNVKKLQRQTIFLSVTAVLLIAGISTSAAAWASKVTPQVAASTEEYPTEVAKPAAAAGNITSGTVDPESVPAQVQEGSVARPLPELQDVPAGSVFIRHQEGSAELKAVPAESASMQAQQISAAEAQQVLTAQPVPELEAVLAESAPAPSQVLQPTAVPSEQK
ncbi:M56 family metallopeptidase [Paenibacillus riograndensis]|nr:M56 family metallopeptidase [Paenibacillus riograndensis]